MATVRPLAERIPALARRFPFAVDAALAVALGIAALISLAVTYGEIPPGDTTFSRGFSLPVVASMLGITLPLAWRRRYPLSVGVVAVVAFLLDRLVVDVPESQISLLAAWLMMYSVAAYGRRPLRTPVLALCFAAILAEIVRELFFATPTTGASLAACFILFYNVVVLALPWLLGSAIRSLRDRQRTLAEQTVELQAEREENARQAVFAERVRIARELHDVVAHHVSVIGVQAGGARRVMVRQPALAAEALSSIEASSRQAVVELQRLLGFLRHSDDVDGLSPQPGLGQLADLIAEAGRAELKVDLTIEGEPTKLSSTLEVSAYRVIQEALTNVRKHSAAKTARVRIEYRMTDLEVEILDDGPAREADPPGTRAGHGLIGMRERAALHGGHLSSGPRPDRGFAVHATFPLNSDAA